MKQSAAPVCVKVLESAASYRTHCKNYGLRGWVLNDRKDFSGMGTVL